MSSLEQTRRGRFSRRGFLKTATALGAAACAPAVVPSSVFGANSPSNRINAAIIGCGNQATIDLPAFLEHDDAQVLAVCDVNTASYGYLNPKHFLGRKPAQEQTNAFYAKKTGAGSYKGCDAYNDFREVLARKDIDAVCVVVPDHWHAIITILAAEAGKDIYCEKPLTLALNQGKAMIKAIREHKRILQTGSHYRSDPECRFACELVRNGRIGQVKRIFTEVATQNAKDPGPGWKPEPVPQGFDYPLWLGPAPEAPYHSGRCLYRFRFNLDYSGGQTTNFGAHSFDVVQRALGTERTGPVEFEDAGSEWPAPGGLYNTATKVAFRTRYANGAEVVCNTTKTGFGIRFEGTEGVLEYGYQGIRTTPESIKTSTIGPNELHLPVSNPARKNGKMFDFYVDHVRNFLDAVKSRQDPVEPIEDGHRTASICHLGNIAMKLKRKITWDPVKEEIIGDAEANAMLGRPMRAPWKLPG